MSPSVFLPKDASSEQLQDCISTNGIAVIRNYLKPDTVEMLKNEVSTLLEIGGEAAIQGEKSKLCRFKFSEIEALEQDFSCLDLVRNDSLLNELAKDFFFPYAPDFFKFYAHYDKDKMELNNAWHFDRGLTLKYFFYLNDVDEKNGAFWYDIGSHRENDIKRYLWWESGLPSLNYVGEEEIRSPLTVEGGAGTLIVFDVAGYHKAGEIEMGKERWVARFHISSGQRADGNRTHRNPFARRNLDYRLNCFSDREEDTGHYWGNDDRMFLGADEKFRRNPKPRPKVMDNVDEAAPEETRENRIELTNPGHTHDSIAKKFIKGLLSKQ